MDMTHSPLLLLLTDQLQLKVTSNYVDTQVVNEDEWEWKSTKQALLS